GKSAWRAARPDFQMSWSTPAIWDNDGVKEVVVLGQLRAKAYDLKTGAERWTLRGLPNAVCTTPVVGDGMLFVATWSSGSANEPMPPFAQMAPALDKNNDHNLAYDEVPPGRFKDFFKFFDHDGDGFITAEEWDPVVNAMKTGKNVLAAIRPGGSG